MLHQMLDSLEGYHDNIATAATQTAATGGLLAELAARLTVSVDTVTRQKIEIKQLTEQINALKKKGAAFTADVPSTGGNNSNSPYFKHCAAVVQSALYRNTNYYFDPHKN